MSEQDNFGPDLFTLVDEDGKEHEFELLDAIETESGERYIALYPTYENAEEYVDSDGELIILKADADEEGEAFIHIEDEDEFNEIAAIFMERLSDEFDFLDETEDN